MKHSKQIDYTEYKSFEEMPEAMRKLIEQAREAAKHSFSPYSNFAVGAAARLSDGRVVTATNVESEVYPQGMCAERTLLYYIGATLGEIPIVSFAVSSISTDHECYPCGACRQSLLDRERRQGSNIEIVMAGGNSATVVDSAAALLPFSFTL